MSTLEHCIWGHANQGGHHDWPFLMALEKGFFIDEGIDLEIRVVPGGDALAQAMGRGEIAIGRMGTPPFLQAVGQGTFAQGVIIASSVIGNLDHFYFVVRRDIDDLRALRGQTIGVLSLGSCDGHLIRLELAKAGLDPDRDVRYKELWSDYETLEGLASGELAAQLSTEPMISLGESRGWLRVVEPVSAIEPHFQWGLLVARRDFVEQRTDLLQRLLRAYLRGARHCQAHPDQTLELIAPRLPDYSPEALERALERTLPIWNVDGQVDLPGLEVAIGTMRKLGVLTQEYDPQALVDLRGLAA